MMADYVEPIYYHPPPRNGEYYGDIIRPSSSLGSRHLPSTSLPRRSRTTSMFAQGRPEEPWDRRAHTQAWVLEQEISNITRKNDETVEWVHKQQDRDRYSPGGVFGNVADTRRFAEESLYGSDFEQDRSGVIQETWRTTLQRHRNRERLVQEEVRRLAAARLDAERCRMAYERRKNEEARMRAERDRERAKRDETERLAWRAYEDGWNALGAATDSAEQLAFRDIPWPMIYPPQAVEDITPGQIVMFLLSPLHAGGLSRKERIKKALLRWHPDRFSRFLPRVIEEDRVKVEEGAGMVARCLNKLLEREG